MQCFRSKKTGEIAEFIVHKRIEDSKDGNQVYAPFVIDPEEWEDYEEPKEYWYVYGDDVMHDKDKNDFCANSMKAIGNCFETKEEAEKAVEKLKAWKRLKDKGFRFILDEETEMPMFIYSGANGEKCITNAEESKQCRSDIKLLFGGEE